MTRLLLGVLLLARMAAAQTVTDQVLLPSYGGSEGSRVTDLTGANKLHCWRLPAPYGITGATKIGSGMLSGSLHTGTTIGFAIYPDDDSLAPLASASGTAELTGPINATVASFSFTQGDILRLCVCSSNVTPSASLPTSTMYLAVYEAGTTDMQKNAIFSALDATNAAIATNLCSTGVPPTSTGALTPTITTDIQCPLILVE